MSIADVLQRITTALEAKNIRYMLTGSFASAHYGAPRSTQDIDIVIQANPAQLQAFIESLPSTQYYAVLDAALEALKRHSMFNVIDLATGWKVDMIIRKSRPFGEEEFGRRQQVNLHGVSLFVASAEDAVISKLEWAKLAHSERQIEDAAAILRAQEKRLDYAYLKKWIAQLALASEFSEAEKRSGLAD